MNGHRIVRALPEHAEALSLVARSVAYSPETADAERGFLVFLGTPQEYRERLAVSPYSVVAVDEDGRVGAFLLTSYQDDFLLIEQIGVAPDARGAGLAQGMFDAVTAELRPRKLAASIMHAPVRNARSIRFFVEKNGFSYILTYEEMGFRWGHYERHLEHI